MKAGVAQAASALTCAICTGVNRGGLPDPSAPSPNQSPHLDHRSPCQGSGRSPGLGRPWGHRPVGISIRRFEDNPRARTCRNPLRSVHRLRPPVGIHIGDHIMGRPRRAPGSRRPAGRCERPDRAVRGMPTARCRRSGVESNAPVLEWARQPRERIGRQIHSGDGSCCLLAGQNLRIGDSDDQTADLCGLGCRAERMPYPP